MFSYYKMSVIEIIDALGKKFSTLEPFTNLN